MSPFLNPKMEFMGIPIKFVMRVGVNQYFLEKLVISLMMSLY